jgi:ABC-type multidrug transport system ATPase subunit
MGAGAEPCAQAHQPSARPLARASAWRRPTSTAPPRTHPTLTPPQPGALLAGAPPGESFCKLVVTLVQDQNNPLHCSASQCTFEEGTAGFSCAKTSCSCPAKGACMPLVQSIVNNHGNGSVGIDCRGSGDCTLVGLQPRLDLACAAGECTQPQLPPKPLPSAGGAPAKPFPTVAMLACLVPMSLALLGGLMAAYVLASGRLFSCGGAGACPAGAGGGAPGSSGGFSACALDEEAPGSRGGFMSGGGGRGAGRSRPLPAELVGMPVRFEFEGVYCAVPDRGGDKPAQAASPAAQPATPTAEPDRPSTPRFRDAEGRRQKVLLHGVSGAVAEGEVVGVMGPSGAGKSTLLSILSGATESVGAGARVEGSVSLGGESRRSVLRKVTAFVPQKDVLLPALTVEECVRYSALLRLPRDLTGQDIQVRGAGGGRGPRAKGAQHPPRRAVRCSARERRHTAAEPRLSATLLAFPPSPPPHPQERIDAVLGELGLSHVATSLVGGSANIRGVSGGERRRVTIAMALVTRPRLVIMDEPTSGLDSYTAYNLMRTAQDIARHGRVVIMSLHQPSPDMFDSLSQVLLLAKGRLAYLGTPANVGPHFASAGYPIPPGRQPAEHMLHVASHGSGLTALLRYGAHSPDGPGAAKSGLSKGSLGRGVFRAHIIAEATVSGSTEPSIDDEWHVPAAGAAAAAPRGGGFSAPVSAGGCGYVPVNGSQAAAAAAALAAGGRRRAGPGARLSHWAGRQARECAVLYWRAFTNMRREPRLLMLHLAVALVLGLVVGAVFFRLDGSNVGLQNRLGSMFFALALFGWTSVSVVDGLVLERELVEREVAGHYYGGVTYLASSLVLDGLLLRTLPALLFCALMYPMVRRRRRRRQGLRRAAG